MPVTGLFLLALQPNQPSPISTIIAHISQRHPATPLPVYSFEHHLFIDTSSLLSNSDPTKRRFVQLLTLPQTSEDTYIATFEPKTVSASPTSKHPIGFDTSLITIPSTSTDTFSQMLLQKLQPQWTPRQSLSVEGGIAMSLTDTDWTIRVGEVRNSTKSGQGAKLLRGVILELSNSSEASGTDASSENDTPNANTEKMLRAFLEALLRGSGVEMENVTLMTTASNSEPLKGNAKNGVDEKSLATRDLAHLYMDLLRGSRS